MNGKGYNEFRDGEWVEDEKPRLKKVRPKDIRGMVIDPELNDRDNRRENRELRKRLARRERRVSKRELWEQIP